ncbi:hypothetical protein LCGC14_3152400, partial [marine sediment metagenome]
MKPSGRLKPRSDKLTAKMSNKNFGYLNKISPKQSNELVGRRHLKQQLIEEYGEHCMTCQDKDRDWRGLSLSHIIPLSRGGETSR